MPLPLSTPSPDRQRISASAPVTPRGSTPSRRSKFVDASIGVPDTPVGGVPGHFHPRSTPVSPIVVARSCGREEPHANTSAASPTANAKSQTVAALVTAALHRALLALPSSHKPDILKPKAQLSPTRLKMLAIPKEACSHPTTPNDTSSRPKSATPLRPFTHPDRIRCTKPCCNAAEAVGGRLRASEVACGAPGFAGVTGYDGSFCDRRFEWVYTREAAVPASRRVREWNAGGVIKSQCKL